MPTTTERKPNASTTNGASTRATRIAAASSRRVDEPAPRQVFLLQRKSSKVGDGLAKTTGWIRRTLLKKRGVQMIGGVNYERIDDAGLHITVDGERRTCRSTPSSSAPARNRAASCSPLQAAGIAVTLIGGADVAAELDAKRAIDQGTRVAAAL
jgi:2,4-dienoyl-CoA reductase (NADPH2)